MVSRYYLTLGNLVNQDQTLLTTVVSLDPMYAYFDMDEPTVLRVRKAINEGRMQSEGQRREADRAHGAAGRGRVSARGRSRLRQQSGQPDHRQHPGPRRLSQPQARRRRAAALAGDVRADPPADRPAASGDAGHRPGGPLRPGAEVRLRRRCREQGAVPPRHDRPAPGRRPARHHRGAEAGRMGRRGGLAAGPLAGPGRARADADAHAEPARRGRDGPGRAGCAPGAVAARRADHAAERASRA